MKITVTYDISEAAVNIDDDDDDLDTNDANALTEATKEFLSDCAISDPTGFLDEVDFADCDVTIDSLEIEEDDDISVGED